MPNSRYENGERSKNAFFWVSSPQLSRHDAPAGVHTLGDGADGGTDWAPSIYFCDTEKGFVMSVNGKI